MFRFRFIIEYDKSSISCFMKFDFYVNLGAAHNFCPGGPGEGSGRVQGDRGRGRDGLIEIL